MIQRIQSIWLLLAAACAFLSMKFAFYNGNQSDPANVNGKLFLPLNAVTGGLLLTVLTVAVAIASLVLIFLYKDRKRQLLITGVTLVFSIINIVVYFAQSKYFIEGQLALTSIITFIIPIWLLLAIRGIWKDEQLVKSTDRLR